MQIPCSAKWEILLMQIFLNQYVMHYLNMLAWYGDEIAELTVSTLSRKKHLELSTLKGVMLTPFLCFITLKLPKFLIKSRLRTAFL